MGIRQHSPVSLEQSDPLNFASTTCLSLLVWNGWTMLVKAKIRGWVWLPSLVWAFFGRDEEVTAVILWWKNLWVPVTPILEVIGENSEVARWLNQPSSQWMIVTFFLELLLYQMHGKQKLSIKWMVKKIQVSLHKGKTSLTYFCLLHYWKRHIGSFKAYFCFSGMISCTLHLHKNVFQF